MVVFDLTPNLFKTYIGRIKDSGFDLLLRASCPTPFGPAKLFKIVPDNFVGYRITAKQEDKVSLAWKTIANHIGRLQQLYEQGAAVNRIAEYVKHWLQWVRSGVDIDLDEVLKVVRKCELGSLFKEKGVWG